MNVTDDRQTDRWAMMRYSERSLIMIIIQPSHDEIIRTYW